MSLNNHWPRTPPSSKEEWDVFFKLVSDIKRQQHNKTETPPPPSTTRHTTVIGCANCGKYSDVSSDSKQNPLTLIPINTLIRRLSYKCNHCEQEYNLLENI